MPLRSNLEIDDLKIDRVLYDEIVLVAGKEHHLRKHQTVKLAQIVNERWIMPPKEEWYHGWLIKLFREEGLILPAPSVVTSSAPVVARLINEDKFVAIRSRLFARYHGLLELKCPLPNTKFS